jgi:hypothetical protein
MDTANVFIKMMLWSPLVVVSLLAIGPNFAGSHPVEDDGFLLAIKVSSTTFLERK